MKKLFYFLCILLTGLIVIACDNGTTPTKPPITEDPPTVEQTKVIATLNGTVVTITPASNGQTLKDALHTVVTDDNRETITKIIITSPDGKKIIPESDLSRLFSEPDNSLGSLKYYYISLTSIEGLDNIDTSSVTDMSSMFSGCTILANINISSWSTENVINMNSMFGGCKSINGLNLSRWNTSNVKNMSGMFMNCHSLSSLNIDNFSTPNVTSMDWMFLNCSLIDLDLSSFDTSSVTDMTWMFMGCTALTSLDISNWDTEKVIEYDYMFDDVTLSEIKVSNKIRQGISSQIEPKSGGEYQSPGIWIQEGETDGTENIPTTGGLFDARTIAGTYRAKLKD